MSNTLDAIGRLADAIRGLPRDAHLPSVASSAHAVKKLGAADSALAAPQGDVLEQVRSRLVKAVDQASGVLGADQRDIRSAVWLLWPNERPLFALAGLKDAVLGIAELRGSVRRNLIEAWIQQFRANDAEMARSGVSIREMVARHQDARLQIWRDAHRTFSFFDAALGPAKLADRIIESEQSVDEVLASIGFDDPIRATSGYAKAIHASVLPRVPPAARSGSGLRRIDRIIDYVAPARKLRFREYKAAVAMALLQPWGDGGRAPPEEIREQVQTFLLTTLGDPRISAEWNDVPTAYRSIMLKWLAKVSLKAFFDLVAEYANDQQFRYRKAFWSAYVEGKHVSEAWLALGSNIYHSANAVKDLRDAYGHLDGAGGNQAIFLLRLGDVVFCEWSHSGALRAWQANSKNAPKLGRKRYAVAEVRTLGLEFPEFDVGRGGTKRRRDGLSHINSPHGYWQKSVAKLIAFSSGGVRLGPKDWMPK